MGITSRSPAQRQLSPGHAEGPAQANGAFGTMMTGAGKKGSLTARLQGCTCLLSLGSAVLSISWAASFMVVVKATGFLIHIGPGRPLKKSPPNRDTLF